ncbi:hypothetical protein BGZ83_010497, partial [Gryganskiella cystojenkinii]
MQVSIQNSGCLHVEAPEKSPEADPMKKFKDVLLVVNFNHPKYDAIEPFLSIYISISATSRIKSWRYPMERYPEYSDYFYTNDDTVLNVYQLLEFDLDKVWKQVPSLENDIRDQSKPPTSEWEWWDQ